jgi:hypothetical protein
MESEALSFWDAQRFAKSGGSGSPLLEHSESAARSDLRLFVHVLRPIRMFMRCCKLRIKGNSNWGKACGDIPVTPSSFEEMVRGLKLSEKEYRSSIPLREWVQKHKDSKYVPQNLLEAWGIEAEV